MDRELHPVLLVLGPAKDHPQARYLVIVKNAMELDGVVAMFVVALAKSSQQIQKISRKAQILRRRRRSNLSDLSTLASKDLMSYRRVLHDWRSYFYPRRSPTLRYRPRRLRSARLAQEAGGASVGLVYFRPNNSGSLAIFTAIRRASSRGYAGTTSS
jgi:hypothetical protein